MDSIAATAAKIGKPDPLLAVFPDLATRMTLCPRYLIDRPVMQASIELSLGRPSVFREAMRHLRIPLPRMWFEWDENHRESLRHQLTEPLDPLKPVPKRLGFLLESEDGRRGTATWVWLTKDESPPNVSPFTVAFDLDGDFPQSGMLEQGIGLAALGQMWADNPVQSAALLSIWRTARHVPSPWGRGFMRGLNAEQYQYLLSDIYGEYIGIWALLLLVTASRPTVEYKPVDRTKLNKARGKKVPLLDHTEVTLHTSHRLAQHRQLGPLGYLRKSPRIHMVSSYLARRGDKHWICGPYVRGKGPAIERHVRVKR